MLFAGLILIVLALAVVAYVWFATVGQAASSVDLGAFSVMMTPLHLFLAGGATVLVLALGAAMFAAGLRRKRRRRHELRDLRTRAAERDRLQEDRELREQEARDRETETSTESETTRPVRRDPTVPGSETTRETYRDPDEHRRDDPRA